MTPEQRAACQADVDRAIAELGHDGAKGKVTDMIALSVAEHKAATFATRCEATAIGLRQLADLGARPDTDEGMVELAAKVTADLLTDPEALLAVALTIEQARAPTPPATAELLSDEPLTDDTAALLIKGLLGSEVAEGRLGNLLAGRLIVWLDRQRKQTEAVRRRLVEVLQQDPIRRVPDDEPLPGAADLVAGDLIQTRAELERNRAAPASSRPPPRSDDLSTLRRGETRLVGGKMWACCVDCGYVGQLDGGGTWHVCDPVAEPGPLGRQR